MGKAQEQIKLMPDENCIHSAVNRSVFVRNLKIELRVATGQAKPSRKVMPLCFMHAHVSWATGQAKPSRKGHHAGMPNYDRSQLASVCLGLEAWCQRSASGRCNR